MSSSVPGLANFQKLPDGAEQVLGASHCLISLAAKPKFGATDEPAEALFNHAFDLPTRSYNTIFVHEHIRLRMVARAYTLFESHPLGSSSRPGRMAVGTVLNSLTRPGDILTGSRYGIAGAQEHSCAQNREHGECQYRNFLPH